jgi:hypothetical protein
MVGLIGSNVVFLFVATGMLMMYYFRSHFCTNHWHVYDVLFEPFLHEPLIFFLFML